MAAFHRTSQEGTQVVALIGAAGSGKTRLVSAFQEWAKLNSPEVEIWQGRAFETGGRLAYQPVVEALRSRLEAVNAPVITSYSIHYTKLYDCKLTEKKS